MAEKNLLFHGKNSKDVNMPFLNVELQERVSSANINGSSMNASADIIILKESKLFLVILLYIISIKTLVVIKMFFTRSMCTISSYDI